MYDIILPLKLFKTSRLTILAVAAVAVCVFVVIVVMTVMNGLVTDFIDMNHGFFSDCVISTDSLVYGTFIKFKRRLVEVLRLLPIFIFKWCTHPVLRVPYIIIG